MVTSIDARDRRRAPPRPPLPAPIRSNCRPAVPHGQRQRQDAAVHPVQLGRRPGDRDAAMSPDVAEFLLHLVQAQTLNAAADDLVPTAIIVDKAKRELREVINPADE